MADIDKSLPNQKTTVTIPGEVEIEEAIQENIKEVDDALSIVNKIPVKEFNFIKNKDNDDKNVSFKLNDFELGEILSSVTSRVPWNGYHSFNDNTTTIRFAPWDKPRKIKGKDGAEQTYKAPAFGLAVTRNGNQNYRIALEPGETQVLKKLIERYFQVVFDVKAAQDEAYRAEGGAKTPTKPPAKKAETSVNNEEDDAPF